MAQQPPKLDLRYSIPAQSRLAEIWRWNAERYGEVHAAEYLKFLKERTGKLQSEYLRGRPVPAQSSYRYWTLKTRARGSGYVVVYQVLESEIQILYYFHTAQDWMAQLQAMLPEV